jgi:hypothetical protein
MHAPSFAGLGRVEPLPAAGGRSGRTLGDLANLALFDAVALVPGPITVPMPLVRLVRDARLVVGVGGGYLRAQRGREAWNTLAFHLPQLALAANGECPAIYLPQSVGPLEGPVGRLIRHYLRRVTWLGLRDDSSVAEVPGDAPAERVPDLAVLAVARAVREGLEPKTGCDRVVIVGREVTRAPLYGDRLLQLGADLDCVFAVHSRAAGQDDSEFYSKIGVPAFVESADAFVDRRTGVAISVRLHGALQAILAGIPAIHLSYERKGRGTYGDLGIAEWLHDVGTFAPGEVSAQAEALLSDPTPFWEKLRSRVEGLAAADARLLEVVQRALA